MTIALTGLRANHVEPLLLRDALHEQLAESGFVIAQDLRHVLTGVNVLILTHAIQVTFPVYTASTVFTGMAAVSTAADAENVIDTVVRLARALTLAGTA